MIRLPNRSQNDTSDAVAVNIRGETEAMARRTFSEDVTWVNKTSANFRTRSRREAHSINSHINGSYARWKRQENARRVKAELLSLSHNPDEPISVERRRRASVSIQAPFPSHRSFISL